MKSPKLFNGIPNKREFLARAIGRLGGARAVGAPVAAWRPGLVVLTYHRIAEPGAEPFYDPVISATPESFRAQIEWLRSHARILTLDELVTWVDTGSSRREPVAVVTFDDGYRDNFDVAVPILRRATCRRRFSYRPGSSTRPGSPGGTTSPT